MSFLNALFGGGGFTDPQEAKKLVEQGAQLIDVRTPGEFAGGAIPGAKNIPVGELAGRLGEVDKDGPVVVYCRSGARSGNAKRTLEASGYADVHNLGPISAWPG